MRGCIADIRAGFWDLGIPSRTLITANAIEVNAPIGSLRRILQYENVVQAELNPTLNLFQLEGAGTDIGLRDFRLRKPSLDRTGTGVRIAVIDGGVDTAHQYIRVHSSKDLSREGIGIPSPHATHCAGIICSQDGRYGGVAPNAVLLNVKVVKAGGWGNYADLTAGIDAAVDLDAHVISLSIGLSHLPQSHGGHGWSCATGDCLVCTAANNASLLDNVIVVAAAGNDHEEAERLRFSGLGATFDTELSCPGQAREAITVGALTKSTFQLAPFSSRAKIAAQHDKPDLYAPGVDVVSTVPPQDSAGKPITNPTNSDWFRPMNGTSVAASFVAGAVGLLIQRRLPNGLPWTAQEIREELLREAVETTPLGYGRLSLSNV